MEIKDMPVTFSYNGKEYRGELSHVMGGGSTTTFHLMVGKSYWGRLRFSEHIDEWVFDPTPKQPGLEKLARDFGYVIECGFQ